MILYINIYISQQDLLRFQNIPPEESSAIAMSVPPIIVWSTALKLNRFFLACFWPAISSGDRKKSAWKQRCDIEFRAIFFLTIEKCELFINCQINLADIWTKLSMFFSYLEKDYFFVENVPCNVRILFNIPGPIIKIIIDDVRNIL